LGEDDDARGGTGCGVDGSADGETLGASRGESWGVGGRDGTNDGRLTAMEATGLRLYLDVGGWTVGVVDVFRVVDVIMDARVASSSPRMRGLESSTTLAFSSVLLGALVPSWASAPTDIFSSTDPEADEVGRLLFC
jgi:hypothetical protein